MLNMWYGTVIAVRDATTNELKGGNNEYYAKQTMSFSVLIWQKAVWIELCRHVDVVEHGVVVVVLVAGSDGDEHSQKRQERDFMDG